MNTLQTIDLVGTRLNPKRKMLLVEDNHESEILMKHLCHSISKDINIKCVQSGELAIHLLEDSPPYDLIISDHYLSGSTTGLDLWKVCKTKFKQIPFMLTSGLTKKEFLDLVNDFDQPLYLPKALDPDTSKKMLKEFLETEEEREEKLTQSFTNLLKMVRLASVFLLFWAIPTQMMTADHVLAPIQKEELSFKPNTIVHFKPSNKHIRNFLAQDLRKKIELIVNRTEEIKNDALFTGRYVE